MGQCCLRQAIGCARNLLEALCRDSSEEEAREADRIGSGPTKRRIGQSVSAAPFSSFSISRNARSRAWAGPHQRRLASRAERGRKCALPTPRWGTQKTKPRLEGAGGLVARCDDRTNWFYAVALERRRRANARRAPQAPISPG